MAFNSEAGSSSDHCDQKNVITTASSEKSFDDSIKKRNKSISSMDNVQRTVSADGRHPKSRFGLQSKLQSLKVKQTTQNISILDWDDTLFCTSSFLPRNKSDVTKIKNEHM